MATGLSDDMERIRLRARCNELLISYNICRDGSVPVDASIEEYQAYLQWRRAWLNYIKEVRDGKQAL